MYKPLQRLLAWALLACLPLVLGGCGDEDAAPTGPTGPSTVITGVATKGPIEGALVDVRSLTVGGAPGDLLGSGETGADGRFEVAIPVSALNGPLLVTVTGQSGASYASESRGTDVDFGPGESFNAVVAAGAANRDITVSPLTEAAYRKLQQYLTQVPGLEISTAVNQANRRIGALLGVADILADPAGDIAYRAALLVIDQMIEDLRAAPATASVNTVTVMALINQAFLDVAAPAYQTYLQALIVAANQVKAANPGNAALLSALDALIALASNPPPELDLTDTVPPTAPTNLTASASALTATTSSVLLAWSPASDNTGVTGYRVFRDGVLINTVTGTGYTDPSVVSNVTYTYTVVAFDAVGNLSPASNQATVTPRPGFLDVTVGGQVSSDILGLPQIDNVPPTAPANLSATVSATSATTSSVLLAWSAATDNTAVTGYDVLRNGVRIATVTQPGYTDPLVAAGVTVTYAVVAFDAAGNRSASSQLSVTPSPASLDVTVGGQVQF